MVPFLAGYQLDPYCKHQISTSHSSRSSLLSDCYKSAPSHSCKHLLAVDPCPMSSAGNLPSPLAPWCMSNYILAVYLITGPETALVCIHQCTGWFPFLTPRMVLIGTPPYEPCFMQTITCSAITSMFPLCSSKLCIFVDQCTAESTISTRHFIFNSMRAF